MGEINSFPLPELLWEAACEYFQWCDENPWLSKKANSKDGSCEKKEKGRKWKLLMNSKCNGSFPDFPPVLSYRVLYLRRRFIQMVEHLSYGV